MSFDLRDVVCVALVQCDTAEFVGDSKESDELGNVLLGIESMGLLNVNGEHQRRLLVECDIVGHGCTTLSTTLSTTLRSEGALGGLLDEIVSGN
jgi:hypothetical protein